MTGKLSLIMTLAIVCISTESVMILLSSWNPSMGTTLNFKCRFIFLQNCFISQLFNQLQYFNHNCLLCWNETLWICFDKLWNINEKKGWWLRRKTCRYIQFYSIISTVWCGRDASNEYRWVTRVKRTRQSDKKRSYSEKNIAERFIHSTSSY